MNPEAVTFTAMGPRGDGIGMADGHRVHVPFVLPGETARITTANASPRSCVSANTGSPASGAVFAQMSSHRG